MKRVIIFLFIISSSFAGEIFDSCPSVSIQFLYVHLKDQDLNCHSAIVLKQLIADISAFSSTLDHERLGVVFHLKKMPDYSYKERGELNIGRIESYWRPGRPIPSYIIKTLWAHEYGHSILSASLANDLLTFKNMKAYANEVGDKYDKIEEFRDLKKISTPYHELFADLISVLYMENPSAHLLVGDFYQMIFDDNRPYFKERNFTTPFSPIGWNTNYMNGQLAPVRYYLWKVFWKDEMTDQYKEKIVITLYHTILHELSNYKELVGLSQEEMNMRIIKQISLAL